jgi:hypothetical protein
MEVIQFVLEVKCFIRWFLDVLEITIVEPFDWFCRVFNRFLMVCLTIYHAQWRLKITLLIKTNQKRRYSEI